MTFKAGQDEIFEYTDLIIQNGEKEIERAYRQAFKEVDDQLKTLYLTMQDKGIPKGEYFNYMTKFNRLDRLRDSIALEYKKAYLKVRNITINAETLGMTETFYRKNYLIQWPMDADQLFTVLDDRVIQESVFGTAQKWDDLVKTYGLRQNYVPQANTLLETLKKNNFDNLAKIQRTLTQSFLQGTSYTKTAAAMRDTFGNIAYNSMRVARTEGTRVMNAGSLASTNFARSQGVEIDRQWLDTGDAVTRATHVKADKQIEDSSGQFHVGGAVGPYPGNMSLARESINCRCTTIEIVEGVSPQLRRAKNPHTGESDIIGFDEFPQYMKDRGMKLTTKGWRKT